MFSPYALDQTQVLKGTTTIEDAVAFVDQITGIEPTRYLIPLLSKEEIERFLVLYDASPDKRQCIFDAALDLVIRKIVRDDSLPPEKAEKMARVGLTRKYTPLPPPGANPEEAPVERPYMDIPDVLPADSKSSPSPIEVLDKVSSGYHSLIYRDQYISSMRWQIDCHNLLFASKSILFDSDLVYERMLNPEYHLPPEQLLAALKASKEVSFPIQMSMVGYKVYAETIIPEMRVLLQSAGYRVINGVLGDGAGKDTPNTATDAGAKAVAKTR